MLCPKGRVGSNPTSGTRKAAIIRDRRFFFLKLVPVVARYRNVQGVANLVHTQRVG